MNLRNKFLELRFCMCEDESQINNFVDVAEYFAIGFAEWIDNNFYQGDDINEYHKSILEYREGKIFTVKQLLEIYKKKL